MLVFFFSKYQFDIWSFNRFLDLNVSCLSCYRDFKNSVQQFLKIFGYRPLNLLISVQLFARDRKNSRRVRKTCPKSSPRPARPSKLAIFEWLLKFFSGISGYVRSASVFIRFSLGIWSGAMFLPPVSVFRSILTFPRLVCTG